MQLILIYVIIFIARYESVYLNQVATIEDYYKMTNLEADVLSAEIKEFIYFVHPSENAKYFHKTFDNLITLPDTKFISKEIQTCVDKVTSLKLWKHGWGVCVFFFFFKAIFEFKYLMANPFFLFRALKDWIILLTTF